MNHGLNVCLHKKISLVTLLNTMQNISMFHIVELILIGLLKEIQPSHTKKEGKLGEGREHIYFTQFIVIAFSFNICPNHLIFLLLFFYCLEIYSY